MQEQLDKKIQKKLEKKYLRWKLLSSITKISLTDNQLFIFKSEFVLIFVLSSK